MTWLRQCLHAHLQLRTRRAILPRDVGNLLRSSEPPSSTTIQIFRDQDANFCIFTVSLVKGAGLRFETSSFPA